MSQIVKTAKPAAASFKLADRITLPAMVTREDAKELARNLWASDASAFAGVSAVASNDNLASKVVSLALSKLVFGEHSRLDRIERYAATLPEYKKSKAGEITGAIGKRISLFREAVTIGAAIRNTVPNIDTASTFNLAQLFGASPVLGGMLLPPPPRKVTREDPTLAAARKETLERIEAEKRTKDLTEAENLRLAQIKEREEKEKAEQERIAAEQAAMTPRQRKAAAKAAEQAEQARLAAEQAEAAAQAAAEEERIAAELRQQGKTLVMKVHAFCSLATELGVKLTITQLKTLNALEYGTKAA